MVSKPLCLSLKDSLIRFIDARQGAFGIIFGLVLIPLALLAGGALDYGSVSQKRAALRNAADSAALMTAKVATTEWAQDNKKWKQQATAAGENSFLSNLQGIFSATKDNIKITIKVADAVVTAQAAYRASLPTNFLKIIGLSTIPISGTVVASVKFPIYTDIHLVIDNSESMGIGAAANDIQINMNTINCSVACHFGNLDANGLSSPARARAAGAVLRIDVVKQATLNALNQMQSLLAGGRVRIAVYTLSSGLTTVLPLTSDIQSVMTAIQGIDLTSVPGQGGTNMTYSLQTLTASVSAAGNGLAQQSPSGVVMLMTDGVQDAATESAADGSAPVSDPNYVLYPPIGPEWSIQAFDPSACAGLKNKNYNFITLQTKYIIAPFSENDNRYAFIRDTLAGSIDQNMKTCASDAGSAYIADAPAEFERAIYNMFARALSTNLALKQ